MKRSELPAFVLIELIIVSAILSSLILVSIRKKAVTANVQANLVSCAQFFLTEYADNGKSSITCKLKNSDDTCTLIIDERSGKIKISTDECKFKIKNSNTEVICRIISDFGDINGAMQFTVPRQIALHKTVTSFPSIYIRSFLV